MFTFHHCLSIGFRRIVCTPLLILTSSTFVGCGDIIEPIVYAKRGGMSPATEDSVEIPYINANIQHELAGDKPVGDPTWRAFWQVRYAGLRDNISRGYPDCQRYIDYIHRQRAAVGLPLYDDKAHQ